MMNNECAHSIATNFVGVQLCWPGVKPMECCCRGIDKLIYSYSFPTNPKGFNYVWPLVQPMGYEFLIMKKAAIRKLYKQKRFELTAATKERLEDLMLIQFQSLHLKIPDVVMTYSPIELLNEYNPVLIEEYCFFKNPATTLVYPVADFQTNSLKPFSVKEDTFFELNEYDIEEPIDGKEILPTAIELMIVPLLSFNTDGYRVGYGKGFYDKFIAGCLPKLIKIGFSFFDTEIIDDVNILDEKLNFCITPERIFEF